MLFLFSVDSCKHSSDCDGVNRGSKHAVHNMDILLFINIHVTLSILIDPLYMAPEFE